MSPKRTEETSNATFQPFHLLKENKINPLNKTSCPKPLSDQWNKLFATTSNEYTPCVSFKSATVNLATEKAATKAKEFPRLESSPFRVNPISANDLPLYRVRKIEDAI